MCLNDDIITNKANKVTDANTDLLFSLFRVVEDEQDFLGGRPKSNIVKRGRYL